MPLWQWPEIQKMPRKIIVPNINVDTLAALRDLLLPKLMSGEIEI